jgi:hypothetical protein
VHHILVQVYRAFKGALDDTIDKPTWGGLMANRIIATCLIALSSVFTPASAADSLSPSEGNPLIGTWALVSTVITLPDGSRRNDPQVGDEPKGYMIYTDANRMCAQFANSRRPLWGSVANPTYEELKSMIDFMGAYCSHYEVNVKEGFVLHHVEIDRVPNLSKETRKRFFRFEGDDLLILNAATTPPGMAALTITWRRVRE